MTQASEPPLHASSPPGAFWTTTNVGEAVPGVMTPLNWSACSKATELGIRGAFHALGALPGTDAGIPPRAEDRVFAAFHGRIAIRVDFFCRMGDAIPGTSGTATAEQILGYVPAELRDRGTAPRRPQVLVKFPVTFARIPRMVRRTRAITAPWWSRTVHGAKPRDGATAVAMLAEAADRFTQNVIEQSIAPICGIQPVFDQVSALAAQSGVDGSVLLGGAGEHEETRLVEDLWDVADERLAMQAFLARHGYHGPREGELSSRSWREDPRPLEQLLSLYAAQPEDASPRRAIIDRQTRRAHVKNELLRKTPAHRRAKASLLLRLADTYLPLRGVGKASFLQSLDVMRFAARNLGQHLAHLGVVEEPDEVFYLTMTELLSGPDTDLSSVVTARRHQHAVFESSYLPSSWQGTPPDVPTSTISDGGGELVGVGASPGIVEGRARVITDPATDEILPGEVLVAHTTDPSWAAPMFVSRALVVDVGGIFSHAAVVARELSIPCVMGAGAATRVIKTGDLCRVDGDAGTVTILTRESTNEHAPPAQAPARP